MNRHAKGIVAQALLASALIWLSLWTALAVAQSNERRYEIDIPALPLSQALQLFSQQTGLQHGYLPTNDEEEKLVVPALKGRYTAEEALTALLPAGFKFAWVNRRTLVIAPPADAPPGSTKEVVVAKDKQRSELSREQQLSMANGGGKSGSARGPYAFDWKTTVEASKIFDLDLDVPVTIFDRGQIEASGASTVADLLRDVTQQPFTLAESYLGDGTQFADLRGLGFDTTLVMINGRRTSATASSLSVNAFDLNSVPLAAVERIEVVTDSTSAQYGADAIGGIFNIILRENIPEPRLDIDYGAAQGGAVERHAAFSMAGRGARARGAIVLDYFDRGPLLGHERDRWNNQDFTRFGSIDWRSPIAAPGNVRSTTLRNLPGLPASFATIPTAAGMHPTVNDFSATAGQLNLESLFKYQSVLFDATRKSAMAQGEIFVTANVSAFGEVLYVDRSNSRSSEPAALASTLVPASNPFNPFGEDVLVDLLLTEIGPHVSTNDAELLRGAAGLRGQARSWDWELSAMQSTDDDVALRINELDPVRVSEALAATDAAQALNVFGGTTANSRALLTSLLAPPARSRYRTQTRQGIAQSHGALLTIPTGRVDAMLGAEWRDERVRYEVAPPTDESGSHRRTVAAAFAELRVPLVEAAAEVPMAHELSAVISGRFDSYSDIGDSFNPQYAVIWRPTRTLMLRTSFSESFRPPPLFDLYLPPHEIALPIADPRRGNEIAFPVTRAGGNAGLKPANAESFTTTVTFDPASIAELQLTASYWQIQIDETIVVPTRERLLSDEDRFPDRVIRDPPSAADLASGLPGALRLIDVSKMNYGSLETSGIDASGSYEIDTQFGRFTQRLSATWIAEFVTSDFAGGADVSRVGVANLQGSVPRWRAVLRAGWDHRGIGLSATARYLPSYDDVDMFGQRTGRDVGAQLLVDAQIAVDLERVVGDRSPWRGFQLRAGVFNLFDKEPPFAEVGLLTGVDNSQADLRQRFAYLKLAKSF